MKSIFHVHLFAICHTGNDDFVSVEGSCIAELRGDCKLRTIDLWVENGATLNLTVSSQDLIIASFLRGYI